MSRTTDLSDAFFTIGAAAADRLECKWLDLLAVMNFESAGVYAVACNASSNASGLIQFMPSTLRRLGWDKAPQEFRRLSALAQLPYVEEYLRSYKGQIGTLPRLYCAVFEPAYIKHGDDPAFELAAAGGEVARQNPALCDPDGAIRIGSLERAVRAAMKGARWEEIMWRAGFLDGPPLV